MVGNMLWFWSIFMHATWALKIPQNVDLDHNWAHKLPPKLVVVPIWRGTIVGIDGSQPGHNLVNLYAGYTCFMNPAKC
jgi:hypothetical protein